MRQFDLITGESVQGKHCGICKWRQEAIICLSNTFIAEANAFNGHIQTILIVLFENISIINLSISQNGVLAIIK